MSATDDKVIERIVESAPDLSAEQLERIRALLRPTREEVPDAGAS